MAIIFNQTHERSELQQRITAELREKQKRQSSDDGDAPVKTPEYDNETSAYLKNTKQTTGLAWAWGLITVAVIGIIVTIIIIS